MTRLAGSTDLRPISLDQDKGVSHRNEVAPIFQLPADILLEIFLLLSRTVSLSDWFPISHVCRAWRALALASASLWTKPPTNLHYLTMLMLGRSKMADLIIYVSDTTSVATVAALMGHMHHIRLLSIIQSPQHLETSLKILQGFTHQASRLEYITIERVKNDAQLGFSSILSIRFHDLPRLRLVKFGRVCFDWAALPLSQLANIGLMYAKISDGIIPATLFFKHLAKMTHLEHLSLSPWTLPRSDLPLPVGFKAVQLPRLLSADLAFDEFEQLEVLLPHLKMPRLRYMKLVMTGPDFIRPSLFTTVSSVILNGDLNGFATVGITNRTFQLSKHHLCNTNEACPTNFFMAIAMDSSPNDFAAAALIGMDRRLFLQINELKFFNYAPSEGLLRLCASCLPGVRSMALPITQVRFLAEMQSNHSVDPPTSTPCFPKLVAIRLVFVNDIQSGNEKIWDEVVHCFKLRLKYGCRVRRVMVRESLAMHPSSAVKKSLRMLGVDLRCFST